ncbi:hypothetical protein [uncultured Jatrophihabitans sp.]|uniref:hypothetical protein n=1 Tax=uncultured Jatrophihabitans sp. TaxID=1610747 RepID=UPI0035CBC560
MSIDWSAFWQVAGVSLAFGLGITVLFALGVMGLSMSRGHVKDEADAAGGAQTGDAVRGGRGAGSILAGTCFVLCVAAVLYGLYLEIPQFH